ncbi:MAG TPA: carboxylesterase family protein [Geothrix sp.]
MNGRFDLPFQTRRTVYGDVVGVDDTAGSGTYVWKGIPFAKPPVGELRWRAPVEPEAWAEPLATRAFGPASAQFGLIHGPGLNNTCDATIGTSLFQPVGSEDCLYLNIWRPATEARDLPVIFFIYGGANLSGYAADPMYDGAALARSVQAVVVTASYRLGVFGWLDLPQLKVGDGSVDDSGNFGTLDQIQTLRFIQGNIAAFGGDPGNVTVMGQSAGAIGLYALMTSPVVVGATPPLFHRAVLMSGGAALPSELPPGSLPTLMPASYFKAQGQALLQALLRADGAQPEGDGQIAAYLRGKAPSDILAQVVGKLTPARLGFTTPIPEGGVVPESPLEAIRAGRYLKVPVLIGATRDEAKLFPAFLALSPALGGVSGLAIGEARRFALMMDFDAGASPPLTEKDLIHPAYLPVDAPVTGYDARMRVLDQCFFTANREAMLKALQAQQADIWCYRFDWDREPAPWNIVYGAAHLFDLPFVFGNFGPSVFSKVLSSPANEGGRVALSEAMMGAIGAFARQGDPNSAALGTAWPAWPRTLIFDATLTHKKITVE